MHYFLFYRWNKREKTRKHCVNNTRNKKKIFLIGRSHFSYTTTDIWNWNNACWIHQDILDNKEKCCTIFINIYEHDTHGTLVQKIKNCKKTVKQQNNPLKNYFKILFPSFYILAQTSHKRIKKLQPKQQFHHRRSSFLSFWNFLTVREFLRDCVWCLWHFGLFGADLMS